jgi:hypothetical protein
MRKIIVGIIFSFVFAISQQALSDVKIVGGIGSSPCTYTGTPIPTPTPTPSPGTPGVPQPYIWTADPIITATVTPIRANQFNELRTAINFKENSCSDAVTAWTEAITAGTPIKKAHIDEIRQAVIRLAQAEAVKQGKDPSTITLASTFTTDPSIVAGSTAIKAQHVTDVRSTLDNIACTIAAPPPPPPPPPTAPLATSPNFMVPWRYNGGAGYYVNAASPGTWTLIQDWLNLQFVNAGFPPYSGSTKAMSDQYNQNVIDCGNSPTHNMGTAITTVNYIVNGVTVQFTTTWDGDEFAAPNEQCETSVSAKIIGIMNNYTCQ